MPAEFKLSLVPKLKVWTNSEIDMAISERTLFYTKPPAKNNFWFRIVDSQPNLRTVSAVKVSDVNNPSAAQKEPAQVSKDAIIYVIDQWPGYLKTKRLI